MAQAVVDHLEAIQVDEHQDPLGLVVGLGSRQIGQDLPQLVAVAQACQGIVVRQVAHPALSHAQGRNVREGQHPVRHIAGIIAHGGHVLPGREAGAIVAQANDFSMTEKINRRSVQQLPVTATAGMQEFIRMSPTNVRVGPAGEPRECRIGRGHPTFGVENQDGIGRRLEHHGRLAQGFFTLHLARHIPADPHHSLLADHIARVHLHPSQPLFAIHASPTRQQVQVFTVFQQFVDFVLGIMGEVLQELLHPHPQPAQRLVGNRRKVPIDLHQVRPLSQCDHPHARVVERQAQSPLRLQSLARCAHPRQRHLHRGVQLSLLHWFDQIPIRCDSAGTAQDFIVRIRGQKGHRHIGKTRQFDGRIDAIAPPLRG